MKHLLPILIVLSVFISCSTSKRDQQSEAVQIYPMVENNKDTVRNGEFIRTKAYLTSNQLYQEAKNNGVENYLKITFADSIQRGKYPMKIAELEGDTGIIEFQLPFDTIPEGSVKELKWLLMVAVNFKQASIRFDTAYLDTLQLYITN